MRPVRAAAGLAAAAVLAGCGTHDAVPRPVATAHVKPRREVALIGGKALQSARCRQWKRAPARERAAIVSTLQVVVGGPTPYGPASSLPPGEATALFDRACSRTYARSFLLYELYTRASAFSGRRPRL